MTSSQILPPAVKSEAASLDELERRIRDAQTDIERIHDSMVTGLSTMVEKAIEIGKNLIEAEERKMVARGQRLEHYRRCNIGTRQAQRYKRLARLAAANATWKSHSVGLSIEATIKKLSNLGRQAKSPVLSHSAPVEVEEPEKKTKKHYNITEAWMNAPLSERRRAIDGIGWGRLLEAIPESWHSLIARHFTQPEIQAPPLVTHQPFAEDLSIPDFLQRSPITNGGGRQ